MSAKAELTIETLGAQGDGIAMVDGGPVFVPGTLPSEVVKANVDDGRATDVEIVTASEHRTTPLCIHFGTCGGCSAQHMTPEFYAAWKRSLVVDALTRHGITHEVEPMVACQPQSRRRAMYRVINHGDGTLSLGFLKAASHDIIDLELCHVVTPGLDAIRPVLKSLAQTCVPPGKRSALTVLETADGFDVSFKIDHTINDDTRRGLVAALSGTPIIRLTVNNETLFVSHPPLVHFGDITVSPPPGGFTQAIASAEETMAQLVSDHLKKSKTIIDLFSGSGTFALRLAHKSAVHAVEGDGPALAALERAWRDNASDKGLRKVTTERRDLFMSPVQARDLDDYKAVVFDPPRAGAEAQVKQIAKSSVPKIAAVSCNPTTLARDLSILVEAGYQIERIVPIDQFLWTAHVEVVALLNKPSQKKRRGLM